eukprot:NODE_1756_length_1822_cov_30.492643_g1490_i0.p1 GENE.NODE_1756_length_1822_cov_30.492643_g1490_i0~~NODE_1756_length_1822_cov_30.492643_g1490_i0.p1  ORF type:complete len:550 (+),score=60.29 NODE_1756_length_1822_cov_30.492643_g1490_i0:53-1651(+)
MFLSKSIRQHKKCISDLGILWTRSHPKIYFSNGLFGSTSCDFKLIRNLDLSNSNQFNISSNIIKYYNLQELDLSDNQLQNLDSFPNMSTIRFIRLDNNPLQSLPKWILTSQGNNIKLSLSFTPIQYTLDISYPICEINNLVKVSFDKLTSLTMNYCNLKRIPDIVNIFNRTLKYLDVSYNDITIVSDDIGKILPKLVYLNVSNNPVISLGLFAPYQNDIYDYPTKLNQAEKGDILTSSAVIDISYANLTKFPALLDTRLIINNNPNLVEMVYSHRIDQLDEILQCTPQLKILNIQKPFDKLNTLPLSLYTLTNLEELDIVVSSITTIADDIINLKSLNTLRLSVVNITELPAAVGELPIRLLYVLNSKHFTKLPLFKRNTLNDLFVFEVDYLSYIPYDICNNNPIVWLSIVSCGWKNITFNLSSCTNTKMIAFNGNQLKELPEMHSNDLEEIDISYNNFTVIPEWILKLTSLRWLKIHGNPIIVPRNVLCTTYILISILDMDCPCHYTREICPQIFGSAPIPNTKCCEPILT